MLEYYGKKHIKVGVIEQRLNFRMRVWRHPLEYSEDVLTRKLLTEISDAEKVVEILDDDGYFMQDMEEMMCGYISKKFGNDSWQHVVQSRWLKIK